MISARGTPSSRADSVASPCTARLSGRLRKNEHKLQTTENYSEFLLVDRLNIFLVNSIVKHQFV
jgi:hypothetical protein